MPYDPSRHRRQSIRLPGYDYTQPGWYFVTICTHGRAGLFGAIVGGEMRLNDAGDMVQRWWGELNHKFPMTRTDAFVVMPDHIHGIIVIVAPGPVAGDDPVAGGYVNPPRHDDADDSIGDDDVSTMHINRPNDNTMVGADGPIRPRRYPSDRNDANATSDANAGDDPVAGDDGIGINVDDAVDANTDDGIGINVDDAVDANTIVGADGPTRPRRHPNDHDDVNDVDTTDAGGDTIAIPSAISLSRVIQWFKIMTTTEYIRHVKQSGWPPFDKRIWQRGYYDHIIRDDGALARIRRYIAENPARWAGDHDSLDALLARMDMKE